MVRLPGCDGGGETTVLAHVRIIGVSGMGLKSEDLLGAWACAPCHRLVDTDRRHQLDFLNAVIRTQAALVKEGVVTG
jgi:hypothetical protein